MREPPVPLVPALGSCLAWGGASTPVTALSSSQVRQHSEAEGPSAETGAGAEGHREVQGFLSVHFHLC